MIAIINFKTYEQGSGASAVKLAKICASVAAQFNRVTVMLAVQAADIYRVRKAVTLPILAQHVDPIDYGSHTGQVLVASVAANGATGSLLNHSERRLRAADISGNISRLKEHDMTSIVCAKNTTEAKRFDKYGADYIAVEPPALIGGKKSVSMARPELIANTAKAIKTPLLVGAGIHTRKDVEVALKLGAKGILVASGILKSQDPRSALMDLLKGFGTSKK